MKTSVILCTKNRLDFVVRFTESLFIQTLLPNELVIVDSSDVSIFENRIFIDKVYRKAINHGIEVLNIKSKPGLTLQRNIGIENSKYDIVFFFDDDIILMEDFLHQIISVFESNQEFMGGMGEIINTPKMNLLQGVLNLYRKFFGLQQMHGDGRFNRSGFPRHPNGTNEFMQVEVLAGGLTAYKKEIFRKFKFDEYFSGYGAYEDVDFSSRVSREYKLFFQPEAKCIHAHADSGRMNEKELYKMYMKNFRYVFFKTFYKNSFINLIFHYWALIGYIILSKSTNEFSGKLVGLRQSIFLQGK